MSSETVREALTWVPAYERVPEPGTECVVLVRYSVDRPPFVAIDTWDIQREDPTGMGGPTIETGEGWNDNDENDVIAWMAVPLKPPADWDQRLSNDDRAAHPAEPPRRAPAYDGVTTHPEMGAEPACTVTTEASDGSLRHTLISDLRPDDMVVFGGPDEDAGVRAAANRLYAEIEAAGGLDAWRAQGTVTGDGAGELPELSGDIVKRLRRGVYGVEGVRRASGGVMRLAGEAADDIERLRAVAQALKGQAAEPATGDFFVADDGRIYGSAFEHDVMLRVSGDYESEEQRMRCIREIARRLNAAEPSAAAKPFYLSGPYHDGSFSVCELATGRVLRQFKTEADLLGPQRYRWSHIGIERYRTMAASAAEADAELPGAEPGAAALTDEQHDAARYRWLRDRVPGGTYRIMGVIYSEGGPGVDAAIDAVMALAQISEGSQP